MIVLTDLSKFACNSRTPIEDVLRRLDVSQYLFQIVLDEEGHLLGTVTDGDIRRAMLQGVTLDEPASRCMQTQPKTGKLGNRRANEGQLRQLGSSRSFLPILDEQGIVCSILFDDGGPQIERALVMAGGFGKRLGEQTLTTPKPLLTVGNKPILEHVISALENAGVSSLHVSVHYLAEQIKAFFNARGNAAEVQFIVEETPLGTAGALSHLASSADRSPILVVNGDLITNVDYGALHEFYIRHNLDAVVCVARYDVQLPYGVVRYDDEGVFAGIDEKPRISNFVAAGIYYLGAEFMALVQPGERMDMPDLLMMGRSIGLKIGLFPIHESWTDVGRPEDLAAANHDAWEQAGGAPSPAAER